MSQMPHRIAVALLLFPLVVIAQTTAPATQPASRPATVKEDPTVPAPKAAAWWQQAHQRNLQRIQQPNINLVFLGDSITERWEQQPDLWQQYWEGYNPVNLGISGDRTQHVLWRIENGELAGLRPRVLVLMIGINNTWTDPADPIAKAIARIVQTIRQKLPDTQILLLGILPAGEKPARDRDKIKAINAQIAKLADDKTVRYLDMGDRFLQPDGTISKEIMPDFLHLSAKGYEIWAETMKPVLEAMMK